MNRIYWLYIIDKDGATLFSFENITPGSSGNSSALLSNFIFALRSIAKSLKMDEVRGVEMGNNKFFLTRETLTNYLFIIKSDRDAGLNYIKIILNQIKNKFIEKFAGHFKLVVDEKIELLNSFKEDVKIILKQDKSNVENFFETLQET